MCVQKGLAPVKWFGAYNPLNACANNWVGLRRSRLYPKNLQDSQNSNKKIMELTNNDLNWEESQELFSEMANPGISWLF